MFGSSLKVLLGNSLVIQWLKLHVPNAGGPVSIPDYGTRLHMPQQKLRHATNKSLYRQIKINI